MKKIIYCLMLLLMSINCFSQIWQNTGNSLQQQTNGTYHNFRTNLGVTGFVYWYSKSQVDSAILAGGGGTVPGGPITSVPVLAFNPGTSLSPAAWIQAVYYASQPPTASLTGGTVYELTVTNQTHNLNWSYGRQSATLTIASAVINPGSLNVFGSQPSQPGTITGTQSVTTTANTNTTYTITVTTTDSKTATASITDTFLPNAYWGRIGSSSPSSATIIATIGGNKILSSSRAQSFTITASGSNFVYFAYPSSEGALTSLTVGGFQSLPAFTQSTVSVTNASGFTQNYFVYVSNNTFSATTPTIVTL